MKTDEQKVIDEQPDEPEPASAELVSLKERLAKAESQKDDLLRTLADYENSRKRAFRELDIERKFAHAKLAEDLLPAFDNLDRAVAAAKQVGEKGPLVDGVLATQFQILDILKRHGIAVIPSQGQAVRPEPASGRANDAEQGPAPEYRAASLAAGFYDPRPGLAARQRGRGGSRRFEITFTDRETAVLRLTESEKNMYHEYPNWKPAMPTYDYVCDACDHRFEEMQSFSAEPLKVCPAAARTSFAGCSARGRRSCSKGAVFTKPTTAAIPTRLRPKPIRTPASRPKSQPTSRQRPKSRQPAATAKARGLRQSRIVPGSSHSGRFRKNPEVWDGEGR